MRKHIEPHDEGHSALRAFTLIELLVVIAIIGILAALLLPVLTRAKQRAQSVQCMSNSKQVALAWIMYADDNNDLLAPNDYPYTTSYFTFGTRAAMNNWVVGTMQNPIDSKTWQELQPSTSNLHTNTVLSRYIANSAVYLCPADHYIDPFSHTTHVRSLSMNSAVGTLWWGSATWASVTGSGSILPIGSSTGGGWLPGAAYNAAQQTWQTYAKMTSVHNPSQIWCVMDENPFSINDGSLAVSAYAVTGGTYLIDFPSGNHGSAAGMAFCDGHSIIKRWTDIRTYTPQLAGNGVTPGNGGALNIQSHIQPDDQDCFYLAPATSRPNQ
jgi:prepilin-type N-terminal cleavage/methylation domain-containing protein/prepilin-type processing-associated H-X9-DG protein